VFHVSLLKKYVHESNHVIDWTMIQVEPEGEFSLNLNASGQERNNASEPSHCAGQGAMEALWSR
jgi:hypothetical protein